MSLLTAKGLRRSGFQFAACGRWEEAFPADAANMAALEKWLTSAGEDVAVEALFCDAAGVLQGFMGFRRDYRSTADRIGFWMAVLAASNAADTQLPRDIWDAWLRLLGVPRLHIDRADEVVLGVFNQWNSAVPYVLHANRLTPSDMVAGPDWIRSGATAPICRENVWWKPERIWLADVVSHLDGDRYFLDGDLLPS
jgi:hypothetical protein